MTPANPPDLISLLQAEAAGGVLTFARFMEICLYHPRFGYYRRDRVRIGYSQGADFFTAASSGPVFGEIVAAACVSLLAGRDPGEFEFVEIGAEPAPPGSGTRGVLAGVAHPFRSLRTIGAAEALGRRPSGPPRLEGPCIVFSNELFDAQPFNRFVFRGGAWREMGVGFDGDRLVERELPSVAQAPLPPAAPEGYRLDAPLDSVRLLETIASLPWTGLFVAIDYGKSWEELSRDAPGGTARAHYRHAQSGDLLARPGEQDLTCHVCWDWLAGSLARHGFGPAQLEFQEAFFLHHASGWLEAAITSDSAPFSPVKRSLMQLLHPSHLGQKFQVLHALR
ncbi:MAG: SAM-dependent methyltransferase [Opitutaceae bacterium]|jgi:SAM-dependent MidA family methyltransferase